MELTRLRIGNMQSDFGDAEGFSFDSHVMGYPPSSTSSFSSDASFGPYTPTSGRSTPPGCDGMNIDTSFTSSVDPFSFDLTPPSSAMSAYFQIDMKPEDSCGFFQPRLLATPSRSQLGLSSLPYGSEANPHTPSQSLDFCTFATALDPSPLPLTPMRSAQVGESWETWAMWAQPESPISFEKQQSPFQHPTAVKHERKTPLSFVPDDFSRRRLFDTAKERTTALQHIQQESPMRERVRPTKKEPKIVMMDGLPVEKISDDKFFCNWVGCTKRFQKKEHLVRHISSGHKGDVFKCHFCDKLFNRTDNRRQHEKLHADERKSGRVKYVPGAAKAIAEDKKRTRSRQLSKSKVQKSR